MPSTSSGSTSRPLTPSSTTSGTPPTRPPTTARPRQNASSTMRGVPSARDGRSKSQASSSARTISSAGSARRPRDAIGKLRDQRLRDITAVPVADQPQRRAGHALGDEPPGGGEILDVLVRLEHAHEERSRLGGQVGEGTLGERLQVGEGDEGGHRLDAGLARQAGRVRRERAHGVRSAERPRGDAVRRPATAHGEAASRRAAGNVRQSPWSSTMSARPRAREAAAGKRRPAPRTGSGSSPRPAGSGAARARHGRAARRRTRRRRARAGAARG